jgi:hypothetical protein
MSGVRLDETTHRYYDAGGHELPGVSYLLRIMGLQGDFYDRLDPYYAIRGRFIHKACHLDMLGQLDDATVDPAIAGYVSAWREFVRLSGAKMHSMETLCYSDVYQYCGTYDFLGWLTGTGEESLTLLDIKSGGPAKWHIAQLAADALASQGDQWTRLRVGNLYLKGSGKFSLVIHGEAALAQAVAEWKAMMQQ